MLNIVRRKVELKCPAENIPDEIIIDLAGTDIGTSIKISSVKLPENVIPTISDRDFVIATVASPTVMKEPEKPAEGEVVSVGNGAKDESGKRISMDVFKFGTIDEGSLYIPGVPFLFAEIYCLKL